MPQEESNEKVFLFFSYGWSQVREGMALVNRSLALSLVRFKNVKVYCTVLQSESDVDQSQRKDAADNHVTLIFADQFPQLKTIVPYVTYLIGHSPMMIDAVEALREQLYPDSKLILFYHVIPSDIEPMSKSLVYAVPSDEEMIADAEQADVVYSVTERVFNYFNPRFSNRANIHVNHKLYHPLCPKEFFALPNECASNSGPFKLFALTSSDGTGIWNGLDISRSCAEKLLTASQITGDRTPELTVSGMANGKLTATRDYLDDIASRSKTTVENSDKSAKLVTDVHCHKDVRDMSSDFSRHALCMLPIRAEPFGCTGLQPLCAGIPTLISDDSLLATAVRKLSTEPDYFLVPVTKDAAAFRQDGSLWKDRVMAIMRDPQKAHQMAVQLKLALKRDESTKNSHDSFVWHCLGGIALKHEINSLVLKFYEDEEKELQIRKNFNNFLLNLLKQCWRLKHDPLTTESDLYRLVPDVDLPVRNIIREVIDRIEERDRRIVAVDGCKGAFIVYCPSGDSLSDLWAMCDRINGALTRSIITNPGEANPILDHFRLREVTFRTVIDGSEFLQLKKELLSGKIKV